MSVFKIDNVKLVEEMTIEPPSSKWVAWSGRKVRALPMAAYGVLRIIGRACIRHNLIHVCLLAIGEEMMGTVSVLGPTRMDYARVIPTVDFIAKSLSRTLEMLKR